MAIQLEVPEQRRQAMTELGTWDDSVLTDFFDRAVASTPAATALVGYEIEGDSRQQFTYRTLNAIVTRVAVGLAGLGIQKGDVVSCQLPNRWQFFALHLACLRIGAVINPIMPIFRQREVRFMLSFAESKLLVVPHRFRGFDYVAMIEELAPDLPQLEHLLVMDEGGQGSFRDTLLERPWEEETDVAALFASRRIGGDDVVQLLYTSGTTGQPKGVLHTSNTLLHHLRHFVERLRLGHDDVVFMASPLAHQTGFLYGLMMPLYLGCTAVLQDVWNPDRGAEIVERERATFTMASTPFLSDLTDIAVRRPRAFGSLRIFVSAGAPIPRPLVEKASGAMQVNVVSAWGMTENGAVTTTCPGDSRDKVVGTDGCPLPRVEVRIADIAGATLPANREGRILVRSPSNFVGYLKHPELGRLDAEGWLDSGDLGIKDEDGYLRITGRSKDVVIRGGENVPVVEIEGLLFNHPAVRAVALVGMPDARLGERVCAFVTLREGYETLSLADLTSFLLEQGLTKQYLPERLEVLDELPHTASGKVQKFRLRELAKSFSA